VFIETLEPAKKLVDDYVSLITLNIVNTEEKLIDVKPSKEWL